MIPLWVPPCCHICGIQPVVIYFPTEKMCGRGGLLHNHGLKRQDLAVLAVFDAVNYITGKGRVE